MNPIARLAYSQDFTELRAIGSEKIEMLRGRLESQTSTREEDLFAKGKIAGIREILQEPFRAAAEEEAQKRPQDD